MAEIIINPRKIQTFGNMIKWARIKSHVSPAEIARKTGVTIDDYYKWENDESSPSDNQVKVLIKLLKMDKNKVGLKLGKIF